MPFSDLIHAEEDLLIKDTQEYVESLRPILPITLTLRPTSAHVVTESTNTFLVGEDVRDTCRQVREHVQSLIQPFLN